MRAAVLAFAFALLWTQVFAQAPPVCHVLCTPQVKVEPTVTFTHLFGSPRIVEEQGITTRERRETEFELIVSLGLPTRAPWLEFTIEAIVLPFDRESTPELEFETNFIWLPSERTRGWVSSHFDIVDKFSAAERPADRRAYTHKVRRSIFVSVRSQTLKEDAIRSKDTLGVRPAHRDHANGQGSSGLRNGLAGPARSQYRTSTA